MITWLWFSDDVTQAGDAQTARPPVSKAQLVPSAKFRAFLHDVIATSESLVLLDMCASAVAVVRTAEGDDRVQDTDPILLPQRKSRTRSSSWPSCSSTASRART
jgi:hypothetical protein